MIRLKIKDKYHKVIDNYSVQESSREVKFSSLNIDFTDKTIADLPLKYQECNLVDCDIEHLEQSDGEVVEGTSLSIDYDKRRNFEYSLLGNLQQNDVPSPNYPTDIKTVTGRNEIIGKNIADIKTPSTTIGGIPFTIKDGIIHINGIVETESNVYFESFLVEDGEAVFSVDVSGYTDSSTANAFILLQKSNNNNDWVTEISISLNSAAPKETNVILDDTKYYRVRWYVPGNTFTEATIKVMLEYGNTKTNFVPFLSVPPIDFGAKDIFYWNDEETKTLIKSSNRTYNAYSMEPLTLKPGKYTVEFPDLMMANNIDSLWVEAVGAVAGGFPILGGKGTFTVYETVTLRYLYVYISQYDNNNATATFSKIYIVKGTHYQKVMDNPLELCKIGNSRDYIYKQNGAWYLHKEIGKMVLNGSENWEYSTAYAGFRYRNTNFNLINLPNEDIVCSHFVANTVRGDVGNWPIIKTYTNPSDKNYIFFCDGTSDINAFKNWLSSNNVTLYYKTNTTDTEITDTNLITQLNSFALENGRNEITVTSSDLPAIIRLHYNFNEEYDYVEIKDTIYTGYVNNFTLPKMKNKKEFRELELDLISPLAMATLRTSDAVGTYKLQNLIETLVQPLINDGFVLKSLNVGNNQITVNYLSETVESSLNKLSNKFNFWWYIDKNKNIYINSIVYLMSLAPKITYNDDKKIKGLVDVIPSIDATDYCNVVNFTNARMRVYSVFQRYDDDEPDEYLYPLFDNQTINTGDEITFNQPIDISPSVIKEMGEKYAGAYLYISRNSPLRIVSPNGDVFRMYLNNNDELILPNNAIISDSFSDEAEWVLVRDSFFKNLIVGLKYNGTSFNLKAVTSVSSLIWTKLKVLDNAEIENNKGIINKSGIVEKNIDMNETWRTYDELLEIAESFIEKNDTKVDTIKLNVDEDVGLQIGDTIKIDKECFLINDTYIITDKTLIYDDNVSKWSYTLKNTAILESFVDLFRASEKQENEEKNYNLITSDLVNEEIKESYEVVVNEG